MFRLKSNLPKKLYLVPTLKLSIKFTTEHKPLSLLLIDPYNTHKSLELEEI